MHFPKPSKCALKATLLTESVPSHQEGHLPWEDPATERVSWSGETKWTKIREDVGLHTTPLPAKTSRSFSSDCQGRQSYRQINTEADGTWNECIWNSQPRNQVLLLLFNQIHLRKYQHKQILWYNMTAILSCMFLFWPSFLKHRVFFSGVRKDCSNFLKGKNCIKRIKKEKIKDSISKFWKYVYDRKMETP